MDKNKNRTDLLAAGRKKLQQFRQKKDGKGSGSQGKSSKKSGKTEQRETDPGVESDPSLSAISTSTSSAAENSALDVDIEPPVEDSEMLTSSVEVSENDVDYIVKNEPPSSGMVGGDDVANQSEDAPVSAQPIAADSGGETVSVGSEDSKLAMGEDIPDTSLVQSRGDQVTELGAMQEGDGLDGRPSNSNSEVEHDGNRDVPLPFPELGKSSEASSREPEQTENVDRVSVSDGGTLSNEFSGPALASDEAEISSPCPVENQRHEEDEPQDQEKVLDDTELESSDLSSVSLSQVIDLIKTLSEEEFDLILRSRESVRDDGLQCMLERLKEELFLTNLAKDVSQMELSQQSELHGEFEIDRCRLVDEIALLSSSLKELGEKNQTLMQELSGCRYELGAAFSAREELEIQFHTSQADFQEVSTRASEWRVSLERSQAELLSLTTELAESKMLVRTLEAENEALNGSIVAMTEDRNKIIEERNSHSGEIDKLLTELADSKLFVRTLETEKEVLNGSIAAITEVSNKIIEERDFHSGEIDKLLTELADSKLLVRTLEAENEALNGSSAAITEETNKIIEERDSHSGEIDKLLTELADLKLFVRTLEAEKEVLNGSIASMTEERNKMIEGKELNSVEIDKLLTELASCKISLEALQSENSNLTQNVSSLTAERKMAEEEKEILSVEHEKLSSEFDNCKGLVLSLQLENSSLNECLDLVREEREKLEEDNRYFAHENERLSSELLVLQEKISAEQRAREQFEVELQEMSMRLEQVIEENIFLSSSLEVHKVKLAKAESDRVEMPLQSTEAVHHGEVSEGEIESREISVAGEGFYCNLEKQVDEDGSSLVQQPFLVQEVLTDSVGFDSLRAHLEEAEKVLHQLEKANEGAQTYSASFSKPGGKMASPAVSKLIQAFESKVQSDEQESEEKPLPENKSTVTDPFAIMKEEIRNLKALFKQLVVDATDGCVRFKEVCDGLRTTEVTYEALRDRSDILEASNIELSILCEVVKQHGVSVEATNRELVVLREADEQEVADLKAEKTLLGTKLCAYESRIGELQTQLYDLQQNLKEIEAVIGDRVEDLQKEVSERVSILEQDWNFTLTQVVEIVQKLGESAGIMVPDDGLDAVSRVSASVNATVKAIEDMQKKLEAARTEREVIRVSLQEANQRCDELHQKNDLSYGILQKIYFQLKKLVHVHGSSDESELKIQNEEPLDFLGYSNYEAFIVQLDHFLSERQKLESAVKKLNSELRDFKTEFEELERGCIQADIVCKLIEDFEGVLKVEDSEMHLDKSPASRLESLASILVQNYKEAHTQLSLSKEEFGSTATKSDELQEEINRLIAVSLQHETEISVLKESLSAADSDLQKRASELEQSEQRVSSIREKLGIAVSKGKGLIVQRDGLKQSLAETSSELERCLQELQSKDFRLHEVETKLKAYSESGERVEALESELSYIRNSATGLRESFLLKDSVLQRIEEILEDLEMPENFHSGDILEKVEWLARSSHGNTLPSADWEQKSSSESGFVMMEPWKEDVVQSSLNPSEDLKRKYEELQNRFYGLAEQNEMLEQSLMERNDLVQRWEELLNRIDMPSQLRSLEPEDRIQWLGRAVSEAHGDAVSLQEKVVNFENYCGSLNADLEDSQRRVSDLEASLETITREKEYLSERLEMLSHECDKISSKATQYEVENKRLQSEVTILEENRKKLSSKEAEIELENKRLQNEVTYLQENVAEVLGNKEQILSLEGEIQRLQSLVNNALQDEDVLDQVSSGSSVEGLEVSLKKLLENYAKFSSEKHVLSRAVDVLQSDVMMTEEVKSTPDAGDSDIAILKKELDEASNELVRVVEERDGYIEKQHLLNSEIEALVKRREELEALLSQEEQRSASVREKLNVAVRKGKSVVQQRDSLKQTIEAMNGEMENLKSEIRARENTLSEYEKKFGELSIYPERVGILESEILSLRNHLTETQQHLHETGHTLSIILKNLASVNVGDGVDSTNPVDKSEQIVKLCRDLHADLISSEEESRKSKRAAELLLAELNEVQERNDNLQDELASAEAELSELTKERDLAEDAKIKARSRLEELFNGHSLEQRNQFSELKALKSFADQLRKGFLDVSNLLADVCSKDLEFLHQLEKNSISISTGSTDVISIPSFNASIGHRSSSSESKGLFASIDSWLDSNVHGDFDGNSLSEVCGSVKQQLQELMVEVGALKEKLHNHSSSLHEQANSLSKSMAISHRELLSRNELHESTKRDIVQVELAGKEKENELVTLRKNFALLCEALSSSITEIQNTKAELLGNSKAAGELASFAEPGQILREELIKIMADRLLYAVRDFTNIKAEIVEGSQKQMKTAIADLQKELQEKEIQKERICMDLVGQIKVAEASAARYSADLQSSSRRVEDLEKQLRVAERERGLLEQKVNELQTVNTVSLELQQRVQSLNGVISAKDQEIESLMQALDEEESQMEDHVQKIDELEKALRQKNSDLENSESSRGKVMKKLSVTVSKFDELHQLSASLLAEVEKLQSQLQDKDSEISFLRQEVTRCTNEVLVASQLSNKRDSDDTQEFLTWFDAISASVGMFNVQSDVKSNGKELLKKKIESVISELVDLREVTQSKDTLLQVERSKVGDLMRKEESLQRSLRDKESRLNLLEGVGTSERTSGITSEITEIEPLINKWTVPGPSTTSQVRSLRKANNDQVAIAIDMDTENSNRLEDEDDDKVHGFKSLATSRIVPRFTRPVTDMVDGLWVSCDRALMRQPALRLGIIIYWALLHALIGTLAI